MCLRIRLRICTHICLCIRKCVCMYTTRNRSWNRNRSRNRNRIQIKCRNRSRNHLQIFRFRNPAYFYGDWKSYGSWTILSHFNFLNCFCQPFKIFEKSISSNSLQVEYWSPVLLEDCIQKKAFWLELLWQMLGTFVRRHWITSMHQPLGYIPSAYKKNLEYTNGTSENLLKWKQYSLKNWNFQN